MSVSFKEIVVTEPSVQDPVPPNGAARLFEKAAEARRLWGRVFSVNIGVWVLWVAVGLRSPWFFVVYSGVSFVLFAVGVYGAVLTTRAGRLAGGKWVRDAATHGGSALAAIGWWVVGSIAGMFVGVVSSLSGGAWGRPLRARGRQVHPELRLGPRPAAVDSRSCVVATS